MIMVCLGCNNPLGQESMDVYCNDCLALSHFERVLITHLAYIRDTLAVIRDRMP